MQHSTSGLFLALALFPACVGASSSPTPDASRELAVSGAPDIDGWALWNPDERLDDPRAGDPGYVYLVIGEDAVLLPGPTVVVDDATAAAIFGDGTASVSWAVTDETYFGLDVVVADVLTYHFSIEDFENEVSPVRVELERFGDEVHSRFVLAADGTDGVAHAATVAATLHGATTEPTGPWTIESRPADF
jgi:hypothetical protein